MTKTLNDDTGIDYVSVADSDASGSAVAQKPLNPYHSTATNSVAWFAPLLTAVQSTDASNVAPGTLVTYTLQISNTGSEGATEVILDNKMGRFIDFSLDAYGAGLPFQFVSRASHDQ